MRLGDEMMQMVDYTRHTKKNERCCTVQYIENIFRVKRSRIDQTCPSSDGSIFV